MAITVSGPGAAASVSTGATSITTAGTANASVGDIILVIVGCANAGTSGAAPTVTVADDAVGSTNVYSQRGTTGNQTAGAASDGASQYFFECPITTALVNRAITVTFSVSVPQGLCDTYRLIPGGGETLAFVAAGTPSTGASATTHSAATVSVTNGDVIFGAAAIETDDVVTGDSDTTNGNWSTISSRLADNGTDPNAMRLVSQYKIVNATGDQSWAATTGSGRDSARNYIIYRSASAATSFLFNPFPLQHLLVR